MSDKQGEGDFISDAFLALGLRDPGNHRKRTMAIMFHEQVLHRPDDGKSTEKGDPGLEQMASKVLGPTVVEELKRRHRVLDPHKL